MKTPAEIFIQQGQIIKQLMEASEAQAKVDARVNKVMDTVSIVLYVAFFISVSMAIIARFC
ncbi:hypothetical protein BRC2024_HCTLARHO_CDS_0023 [Acinetobacter phage vB_AbaS_Silvergun]